MREAKAAQQKDAEKQAAGPSVVGDHATFEGGALKAALATVGAAVQARNTVPILANVLLNFDGGRCTVTATDLDMVVERSFPADHRAHFSLTVPGRLLRAIVDKLPTGDEVALRRDAGAARAVVSSGRARFELPTLPVEDFPLIVSGEWDAEFEMAGAELAAMLATVKMAISTEETRYYLNGVFFERKEAELWLVATDGYRLSATRRPAPDGTQTLPEPGIILPRGAVPVIEQLCAESSVEVAVNPRQLSLAAGESRIVTKLVDGIFPDWRRVVPPPCDRVMRFDPAQMKDAVDRVATMASDKTRRVQIDLEPDTLRVSVTSPENGTAQDELAATMTGGDPLTIGANARYLNDFLARFTTDEAELLAHDAAGPMRLRSHAESPDVFVLMPMRV